MKNREGLRARWRRRVEEPQGGWRAREDNDEDGRRRAVEIKNGRLRQNSLPPASDSSVASAGAHEFRTAGPSGRLCDAVVGPAGIV